MRIDPAIASLRRDPMIQRRARARMVAAVVGWRGEPEVAAVLAALERFGAGAPLRRCPDLHRLFAEALAAPGLAGGLCGRLAAELGREPFGQPPFRHGFDGVIATLQLARSGRAQLFLHAHEPGWQDFATVEFSQAVRHEAVLAGRARARLVRRSRAAMAVERLTLEPGTRLALDLRREALQVIEVEPRLVSLRLHRFARSPGANRSYALADGALLRQSAGDLATSRREIALAVLGRMGRSEAAPAMAALARAPGDDSLRWQALRECLALDTAEGFAALGAIADSARDPLARPARTLRAQLVADHPLLRSIEPGPCPA